MKILMICPQFFPLVGGYERAAERLAIGLAAKGHTVAVISERRSRDWSSVESHGGVEIRRWWSVYRRGVHSITSLAGLLFMLVWHGWRFDVWHVHQFGNHASLAILLGRTMAIPVVLKWTSTKGQGLAASLATSRLSSAAAAAHRLASAMIVLSREMLDEAVRFGVPHQRIHLLGNGIDTQLFCPRAVSDRAATRARLGLTYGRHAVFVGRLAPEKNMSGLLRGWFAALPRLPEPWFLHVIGDGPERARLELEASTSGAPGSVLFHGVHGQGVVADWLAATDLFLQFSYNEGLSNTMLEAMASGVPVICTSVSGTEECVREPGAGLVVPIDDSMGLANAVVALASDASLREQMSQRGIEFIRKSYSISHVCDLHERLYRRLVHHR